MSLNNSDTRHQVQKLITLQIKSYQNSPIEITFVLNYHQFKSSLTVKQNRSLFNSCILDQVCKIDIDYNLTMT